MARWTKAQQKAASRKHYEANKTTVRERIDARRSEKRQLILDHLLRNPCIDCGESDPVVLDFDHREPADKLFSVANGITRNIEALLEEMKKCDVRCANCHRRRTAKQFNWFRYRESSDVAAVDAAHLERRAAVPRVPRIK